MTDCAIVLVMLKLQRGTKHRAAFLRQQSFLLSLPGDGWQGVVGRVCVCLLARYGYSHRRETLTINRQRTAHR